MVCSLSRGHCVPVRYLHTAPFSVFRSHGVEALFSSGSSIYQGILIFFFSDRIK